MTQCAMQFAYQSATSQSVKPLVVFLDAELDVKKEITVLQTAVPTVKRYALLVETVKYYASLPVVDGNASFLLIVQNPDAS
jgi:hypothetical protein